MLGEAGIAQAGNDVAVLVQVIVHRTHIDVHIGMDLLQVLNASGAATSTMSLMLWHPRFFISVMAASAGRRWPAWDPR